MTRWDMFMRGVVLVVNGASRPVDFAVSTTEQTIVYIANWWQGQAELNEGFVVIESPLEFDRDRETFNFPDRPDLSIELPDDDEMADWLRQAREASDIFRGSYVQQILVQREENPAFNYVSWLKTVEARPTIDAESKLLNSLTGLRKIGSILAVDNDNKPVDALVIDERGNAATVDPDGWLEAFGWEWVDADDHEDVEDYLTGLSKLTPYGGVSLLAPVYYESEGHVEDMAHKLVSVR